MRILDDWDALKPLVLSRLREAHDATRPLRVWVSGCACGEEAYALGILICDAMEALPANQRASVRILATDTDHEAIRFARRGWYPDDIATRLQTGSGARLLRREQGGYRVRRELRDLMTFATHDLKTDPPFAKLDLVVYRPDPSLTAVMPLQRLAPLFHFALARDGLLVLSSPDAVAAQRGLFAPIAASIYRRLPSETPRHPRGSFVRNFSLAHLVPTNHEHPGPKAQTEAALLRHFALPSVLVNDAGDILYFTGRTGAFLDMPGDEPRWNVYSSAVPELRAALPVALENALRDRRQLVLPPMEIRKDDASRSVQVSIQPVQLAAPQTALIVFREVGQKWAQALAPSEVALPVTSAEQAAHDAGLENSTLRREMQDLREKLGVANEELQSINEELTATNDDLRASSAQVHAMNDALLRSLNDSQEAQRHLETLSHRLVGVQELERRRLSAELHDRTSPNLASINLLLKTLCSAMPAHVLDKVAPVLEDLSALLEDTTASIREICADLRPPVLDHAGLVPALESYSQQFAARTGIEVRVDTDERPQYLSTEHESLLFRIAQEALANCAKHSQADRVDIILGSAHGHAVLTIADNGVGFSLRTETSAEPPRGLGLLTMRERAEFAGGRFTLHSRPGHGTRITVEIGAASS